MTAGKQREEKAGGAGRGCWAHGAQALGSALALHGVRIRLGSAATTAGPSPALASGSAASEAPWVQVSERADEPIHQPINQWVVRQTATYLHSLQAQQLPKLLGGEGRLRRAAPPQQVHLLDGGVAAARQGCVARGSKGHCVSFVRLFACAGPRRPSRCTSLTADLLRQGWACGTGE